MSDPSPCIVLIFDQLGVKALESELVTLAGHLVAGTCWMLQLLARSRLVLIGVTMQPVTAQLWSNKLRRQCFG
jgi:hypothetical protein